MFTRVLIAVAPTVSTVLPLSTYPVMDQPNVASTFYGPVLLAAGEPASVYPHVQRK